MWKSDRTTIAAAIIWLGLIAAGAATLKLPMMVAPGRSLSWFEALFTSVSAVCMVGLTLRDPAGFSVPGHTVITGLVQAGAILTMVIGSLLVLRILAWFYGRRGPDPARLVGFLLLLTVVVEAAGTLFLLPLWDGDMGRRIGRSLYYCIHAFCQGGFDLTGQDLVGLRYHVAVHGVIGSLAVLGGLGGPALYELVGRLLRRRRCLGTYVHWVLGSLACLYLCGVAAVATSQVLPYFHDELQQGITAHAQRPGPLTVQQMGGILADASFLSISCRSAGFHTLAMDQVEPGARIAMMVLMSIGGATGSMAGGVTVCSLVLIVVGAMARWRGRTRSDRFDVLAGHASDLALCFAGLIIVASFALSLSEPYPFGTIIFEIISAVSATGLSLGITSDLTVFGKIVILAAMLSGRLLPLIYLVRICRFTSGQLPQDVSDVSSR